MKTFWLQKEPPTNTGFGDCVKCGKTKKNMLAADTTGGDFGPEYICQDCLMDILREIPDKPDRASLWDFTKVKWEDRPVMRYDTPGDYQGDTITAWSGLGRQEYVRAVQYHEFVEAVILRAAGITPEIIDVLDKFKEATRLYGEKKLTFLELSYACLNYESIPTSVRNLYDQAHIIALLAERAFIEACGLNWKEYDDFIESTRGKIPVEPGG